MDSFSVGVIAWLATLFVAFAAGQLWPLDEMVKQCSETGETTVRTTVLSCKPIATIINDKRVTFQEAK